MSSFHRALKGHVVNVSISESDDSARLGFPDWQVNRVTIQVVAALFGQGASIVFGHDWRRDGVMEAVHAFALQVQPPVPLSPEEAGMAGQPLLWNLLPWPDVPTLPAEDLERLRSTLRVEQAGLPEELRRFDREGERTIPDSPPFRYLRARGLTFLRHRLDKVSTARLCLGGRRAGSAGRYPGVIEEALFAVTSSKSLYVASMLGGAAAQIVDAIEGKPMPEDFCGGTAVADLYRNPPIQEFAFDSQSDRSLDSISVWRNFGRVGVSGIATANGLTVDENRELFHTPVLGRVVELVLTGLSRLKAPP